ncbi:Uncharacterized protein EJ110_NYTH36592 [Nymphaea thermarum]|nr:Uncharacterized protein EJ110_NYTH36592 [Nymphaea thermarum]
MEKSFLILSLLMLTLINFLHVPSFILEAQADINIACGATDPFTDSNGNDWEGDDSFIHSGSIGRVQNTSQYFQILPTVRYFSDENTNCYTIPIETQENKTKVVAIFLYGNFDNLAQPPSFMLQIDNSNSAQVNTSMDDKLVAYEMTYWPLESNVSVCLAPDETGGVPFISAIQIMEAPSSPPSPSTEFPPPSPSTEPPPDDPSTEPPPSPSTEPPPPNPNTYATGLRVFLSIDCGVTGKHSDGLGINWIGDDGYIKAGKAAEVQNLGIYSREHNSLGYFPSQKKSCYLISGVTTGRKHMIRAHFFYGNYDGKSSPPSFDLQFDGNHWTSVTTSSTASYYSEIIYAPKGDNISVCLSRTSPNQTPFISILVIREFELGMYETDDEEDVLLRRSRLAFGAKDLLRYPDDPYDRYWYPSDAMDGVMSVARDNMSFIQDFQDIPGKALVNAITPASSIATTLTVPTSGILSVDATYYYIFYFMEVLEAAYQNKNRSFDFLVDGIKRNGDPIIPPYQSYVTDHNGGRYLTTGSVISLVNTADTFLPPILNAMEVFRVQRGLAAGTNGDDGFSFSLSSSLVCIYGIGGSDK